jgi:DNA polymerase III epsilon subunit-like protein
VTTYIGLDLETSGTDIGDGSTVLHPSAKDGRAAPIQLGMATADGGVFCEVIGGWDFYRDHTWSDEAGAVHGIPFDKVEHAPPADEVAERAVEWVAPLGHRASIIPVGWNIAGFDMPFVKRFLPSVQNHMSYRTVDLNAICFALSSARVKSPLGGMWGYKSLKSVVKDVAGERAAAVLGEVLWHDAGFDALASLYAFDALQAVIRGDDPRAA